MSRPRSDVKRTALLDAATRMISAHGLAGASTSAIAKEAGVANGSLFVYFETKSVLLNELYVLLKSEMGEAAFASVPRSGLVRERMAQMWSQWLAWATTNPHKRRTLAQLEVAEDITEASHAAVRRTQRGMAELVELARAGGPVADVPLSFAMVLTGAIADSTMDALIRDPVSAGARSAVAFDAVWRVLAG